MKKLLLMLSLLLFTACGSKKFYTLGDNLNINATQTYAQNIDVVKVNVPKYLQEEKIVRQVNDYQIEFVDKAQWLIPMDKKLTQMLIEYLQQSMNNPNVHLYPWDSNNKTDKRVSVEVRRFIASNTEVTLKANYKVVDVQTNTTQSKIFKTTVESKADIESMMNSMEKAYLQLAKEIKLTIINNK